MRQTVGAGVAIAEGGRLVVGGAKAKAVYLYAPPPPQAFSDATDLWLAVWDYTSDAVATERRYGPISEWDVSAVKSLESLFESYDDFNGDISAWDVSSVTRQAS